MSRVKPLPESAERVFKGVIFEIWQWKQQMFDGTIETFERAKRADTTVVIATMDGKIVLQVQEQPDSTAPFPCMPGGRFNEGEEPLACAKRELLEETGFASDDWVLWKEYRPAEKIEWIVHAFVARDCKKVAEPHLDAGEKVSISLIDFDEFLALSDNPAFGSTEITAELLRARLHPEKRDALHALIFGSR